MPRAPTGGEVADPRPLTRRDDLRQRTGSPQVPLITRRRHLPALGRCPGPTAASTRQDRPAGRLSGRDGSAKPAGLTRFAPGDPAGQASDLRPRLCDPQPDDRPRRRWCMNRNWPATILTQRLLTYRYRTTLARQGPSSDLGCCMRAAPRPFALLACALEGQCR